jgi:hypothetical protein
MDDHGGQVFSLYPFYTYVGIEQQISGQKELRFTISQVHIIKKDPLFDKRIVFSSKKQ